MNSYEKWSIIVGACSAIATFFAVIVAMWGEKFRQWWSSPKLTLALEVPALTTTNSGQKGWYYILRVKNERRSCPAMNVRVLLTRVLKKAPDDTWTDHRFSGPTQVLWRWFNVMPLYITVGPDNHATFASLLEGSNRIELKLVFYPNNLNPFVLAKDPTRLVLKAVSDTQESDEITIEIAWDGKWSEGRLEITEHLKIKEVTNNKSIHRTRIPGAGNAHFQQAVQ